ncbi:growth arrest-specific protein 6-like, partial [Oncorhynchus keta]|uniref:growth arrest-specific protein 6-like n=1 Tax=Oncorhynchus keta TaxID=8018 RepID=UPI00227CE877
EEDGSRLFAWKRLVLALLTLVMWVHPKLERILENECYSFVESRSSYLLYTRKSFVGNVPILDYKVTELTSFDSGFELRSLDPGGVMFFGDIDGQQNYFLLAVVHGNLSVQTSRGDRQVLVTSWPRLSNGLWMPITVMKQEGAVAVRVGSEAVVTVQQSAESHMAEIVLLGSSSAEPDGADWTLSVELALRTVSFRGSLLILVDTQNDYILSLKLNHPSQVRPEQLVIGMGVTKATMKLTDGDYELLKRVLSQPGSMV